MTRILVIDDEPPILRAVGIALSAHDYDVEVAANAKQAGFETAVFDRGGYLYHGRVRALADGAREGGLNL